MLLPLLFLTPNSCFAFASAFILNILHILVNSHLLLPLLFPNPDS